MRVIQVSECNGYSVEHCNMNGKWSWSIMINHLINSHKKRHRILFIKNMFKIQTVNAHEQWSQFMVTLQCQNNGKKSIRYTFVIYRESVYWYLVIPDINLGQILSFSGLIFGVLLSRSTPRFGGRQTNRGHIVIVLREELLCIRRIVKHHHDRSDVINQMLSILYIHTTKEDISSHW